MIITVTPNPSIDRTQVLATPLVPGGVHRVLSATDQAGGKGVNVARVLHDSGVEVRCVVDAVDHGPFANLISDSQVPTVFTRTVPVRTNLTILDADAVTTKINEIGHHRSPAALSTTVDKLLGHADWLVLAGSLPPGYPIDWYARMTSNAHRRGVRVAVDTSGAPLTELLLSSATVADGIPDVVKPNSYELAEMIGLAPDQGRSMEEDATTGDLSSVAEAAAELVRRGFPAVLVSLGSAGALLSTDEKSWHCSSPAVDVVSTVGAGDSTLAGYLIGTVNDLPPEDRLALAVAHGTAAVTLPGTTLPIPEDLPHPLPSVRPVA